MEKQNSENADNALRAWYLARARKAALAEQVALNATPNTLVNADAENLKRLIEDQAARERVDTPDRSLVWALVAGVATAALLYMII